MAHGDLKSTVTCIAVENIPQGFQELKDGKVNGRLVAEAENCWLDRGVVAVAFDQATTNREDTHATWDIRSTPPRCGESMEISDA